MYLFLKEVVVAIIYIFVVSYGYPVNSNIGAVMYLYKYGYLQESDITACLKEENMVSASEGGESALRTAFKDFQRLFGLKETGSQHKFVNPVSEYEDEEDTLKLPADNVPDLCINAEFDTITRNKNGVSYIFKGDYYWKYICDTVDDDYPRKISEDWDGLEGNLDASFSSKNGSTYFFKGNRYWRFTNKKMDTGYPKVIGCKEFQGIPPNLDAALVWNGDHKVYFFKGDKYWRYDFDSEPPVSKDYPASIKSSHWHGLPVDGINAAESWENNVSYFFKGEKYYRFNDVQSKVTTGPDLYGNPPYPRPTAKWWFKC